MRVPKAAAPVPLTCAQGGTCNVGDSGPAGGVIVYAAESRQSWGQYLEAAPLGWAGSPLDPQAPWCVYNAGATAGNAGSQAYQDAWSWSIGHGATNTRTMLSICSSGAASIATAYTGGGKSDWFLPSYGEAQLMVELKLVPGLVAVDGVNYRRSYWTSSRSLTGPEYVPDDFGGLAADSQARSVHPIRAF